jgi:hypothetical protein
MTWSAKTLARAVRALGHRTGRRPSAVARFPLDVVGVVSLAVAALFIGIAIWAGVWGL